MSNFTKINGINAENVAKIFGVQTENIAKIAGKEPAEGGGGGGGVSVPSPALYFDGSSTSTQLGSNTLSAVTIDNTDGKYENGFFNFGTSGTKNPARVGTQVSLSTGIYTFSLWFKNKRGGSDFGSVIRQSGTGPNSAHYAILTNASNELGLHKGAASNTNPNYGFYSSGYDMTDFEGDTN